MQHLGTGAARHPRCGQASQNRAAAESARSLAAAGRQSPDVRNRPFLLNSRQHAARHEAAAWPPPRVAVQQRYWLLAALLGLLGLMATAPGAAGGLNYGLLPPPPTLALLGGALLAGNATATIGAGHTCVVGTGGRVQCAGYDGDGQIDVPTHTNAAWACAGMRHSCAVVNAVGGVGTTLCWGQAGSAIGAVSGVAQVTCGGTHSCALFSSNGSVVCGGDCAAGQCAVPAAWSGIAMTSAGTEHTLVLFQNGSVACVGSNAHGQCTVPPASALPAGVSWVSAGAASSCAANATGAVTCWGNLYLQPTPSPTVSPSPSSSVTAAATRSWTPSALATGSQTGTPAVTPSASLSPAATPSITAVATVSSSVTAAPTVSSSITASSSVTPSAAVTAAKTPSTTPPPDLQLCYTAAVPYDAVSGDPSLYVQLSCPTGSRFAGVTWASYGVFDGACPNYWSSTSSSANVFVAGTLSSSARCTNTDLTATVAAMCGPFAGAVGCMAADSSAVGDPCPNNGVDTKTLAVKYVCRPTAPSATPSTSASKSASPTTGTSPSASFTALPSVSRTAGTTTSPTPSGSTSPSDTASASTSATASVSPSVTASQTGSGSGTTSMTKTGTGSPSVTASATPSFTGSGTGTAVATGTQTPSATPSDTCSGSGTHTPTATPSVSASVSPSGTASWTGTPSGTPSAAGTGTSTNSPSITASSSWTATVTPPPSPTESGTRSGTPTVSTTASNSASASGSPSVTASSSSSASNSVSGTVTPSVTATASMSASITASGTGSGSVTASASASSSETGSGTKTASITASSSPTSSITASGSATSSITASSSPTPSITASGTRSPSITASGTPSPTVSPSSSGTAAPTVTASPTPPGVACCCGWVAGSGTCDVALPVTDVSDGTMRLSLPDATANEVYQYDAVTVPLTTPAHYGAPGPESYLHVVVRDRVPRHLNVSVSYAAATTARQAQPTLSLRAFATCFGSPLRLVDMGEVAAGAGGGGGVGTALVSLTLPPLGDYYILVSPLSAPPAGSSAMLTVAVTGMRPASGATVLTPNPTPAPPRVTRPAAAVCAALSTLPPTSTSFWSSPLLGPLTGLIVVLVAAGAAVLIATLVAVGILVGRRRGYACCCCRPLHKAPPRKPDSRKDGDDVVVPAVMNPMIKRPAAMTDSTAATATATTTTDPTTVDVDKAATPSATEAGAGAASTTAAGTAASTRALPSPGSHRLLTRSPSVRDVPAPDGSTSAVAGSSRLLTGSPSTRGLPNSTPAFVVAAVPAAPQLSAASLAILAADGLDCPFCTAKNGRIRELEAELAALRAQLRALEVEANQWRGKPGGSGGGGGGGGGGGVGATTNRAAMLSYARPARGGGHVAVRRNVSFVPRAVAAAGDDDADT